MQAPTLAAILIDADNLQDETWLEAVREQVRQKAGRLPVIRAYGSPSRLQSRLALWARLGVELVPHLPLDKNTTDASLLIDAMELCCREGVRFFAIASGDADFAPLAVRLRARGCEVWCFAVTQTLFSDAQLYYDKVVRFEKPPMQAPAAAASKAVPQHAAPSKVPVSPMMVAALSPAPSLVVSMPAVPKQVVSLPPAVRGPGTAEKAEKADHAGSALVSSVLKTCPELRSGKPFALSLAIPMLRKKGIIGPNEKPRSWGPKLAPYFLLQPAGQPNAMRYIAKPASSRSITQSVLPVSAPVRELDGATLRRTRAQILPQELHALRAVLWECAYRKVSVADVLLTVPEMLDCTQRFSLSSVAGRLRVKGMLATSQSALEILGRYPNSFAVELTRSPQSVRYLG